MASKSVDESDAARKNPQVSTMPYVPCSTMQLTFCSSNWRVKCIKKMNSFPAAYWRGLGFSLQFLFAFPFSLGRQKLQFFFCGKLGWWCGSFFAHSIIKRLCLVWWSSSLLPIIPHYHHHKLQCILNHRCHPLQENIIRLFPHKFLIRTSSF